MKKIPKKPIIGAIGALVVVNLVRYLYGLQASIAVLLLLILGWGAASIFYQIQLSKLVVILRTANEEERRRILEHASPKLRSDIVKRESKSD